MIVQSLKFYNLLQLFIHLAMTCLIAVNCLNLHCENKKNNLLLLGIRRHVEQMFEQHQLKSNEVNLFTGKNSKFF